MANSNCQIVDKDSCIVWLNCQLAETDITVTNLRTDLSDGLVLATLVNVLAKEQAVDLTKRKFKVMFITTCLTVFHQKGFCKKREPPSIFIEGDVRAIVEFLREVQSEIKRQPTARVTRKTIFRKADVRWNIALKQKQQELSGSSVRERPKSMVEMGLALRNKTDDEGKMSDEKKSGKGVTELSVGKRPQSMMEWFFEKRATGEEEKQRVSYNKSQNQRCNKEEALETLSNKEEALERLSNKEEAPETVANKEEVEESYDSV